MSHRGLKLLGGWTECSGRSPGFRLITGPGADLGRHVSAMFGCLIMCLSHTRTACHRSVKMSGVDIELIVLGWPSVSLFQHSLQTFRI